ncbi:MAG: branched-chain amino acid ABC transporter ATP-binding protein/permease [Chloroflexi bacterium]|nr:branched-chain amino acid ABC transporter ATP-binding protein/permease [Chloroflexota bacterium]MCI0727778.1 branched-chain amino acid ABC transporter ATP-binding protein/permease [Chloroflexota bacterium]
MLEPLANESFLFLLVINIIASLGMAIVYATGQLNLGQAGFLAIGAYTAAVTNKLLGWPLAANLVASGLIAGLIALPIALGANRVRGIYLIMGTLAVGEIVQVTISNVDALGGLQGYSGIAPITLADAVIVLALVFVATAALMASPMGLQMRAIFDDEDAAAAAGVATRRVKVVAVVLSAAVVGMAGGLMARWLLFIAPRNFGVGVSFRIALFILIGGVHSIWGAVLGAFSVTYLLEVLRVLGNNEALPLWMQTLGPWRQVIYGALVMVLMKFRPEGIISRHWALRPTRPLRRLRRRPSSQLQAAPRQVSHPAPAGSNPVPLLQLGEISHNFGGLAALQDVSLTVDREEIMALIGANGAGKTTLINVVSGRYALQKGRICLLNQDLSHFRPERRTRAGVSRTFQAVRTFAHLTVEEQLRLGSLAHGGRPALSVAEIAALIGLADKLDTLPETLSLGEQRRLEIGRAIASRPWVIFLDEPSVGMNLAERQELAALIRQVREQGITVVLVDHNLDLALSLADRVAVLDFGKLLTIGLPGDVIRDRRVRDAYLGNLEVTV